ncbi:hypothetical protein HaLaN_29705 [Haematococcus lacustris]|uniref:FF domain-containing protein n=1 Tax=Haematococcus lacustris TaxID=44745 RepID=A0A6A0ADP0_HAELA|nr:hypothetical protein HaLaN_29705 [Haematococcus lacustris]
MRMLRTKQPPMSSTTSFTEVERQFGQDARFLAVASEERRLLVAAYVDALLQAELRQAAASEAKLRERMM